MVVPEAPFRSKEADEVVHAAGVVGAAAVGQEARLAMGAGRTGIEDVPLMKAQAEEQPGVGGPQVEKVFGLKKGDTYLRYMSPCLMSPCLASGKLTGDIHAGYVSPDGEDGSRKSGPTS